jgi:hypothetical protein
MSKRKSEVTIDPRDDKKWVAHLQKLERQEKSGRFPKQAADPDEIEWQANIARRYIQQRREPTSHSSGSAAKAEAE